MPQDETVFNLYYDELQAVYGPQGTGSPLPAEPSASGVFDVMLFGNAAGDGVTDDTAAIGACILAANALKGTVSFPPNPFLVNAGSLPWIACNVQAAPGAQIITSQTNINVLQLGDPTTYITGLTMFLPQVLQTTPTWGGNDVGITVSALNNSVVYVPRIEKFSVGLQLFDQSSVGLDHNAFMLGRLYNNKIGNQINAGPTGFVVQNAFYSGEIVNDGILGTAGTRSVQILNQTLGQATGNTWYNVDLGSAWEFNVECFGSNNTFSDCRFESNPARVWWRSATASCYAQNNWVRGGFLPTGVTIAQQWDNANCFDNYIEMPWATNVRPRNTTTGDVVENTVASANPIETIMPAGGIEAASNPATAYIAQRSGTASNWKQTADTGNRVTVDGQNGRLYLDNGAQAARYYLSWSSGVGLQWNGGHLVGASGQGWGLVEGANMRAGTATLASGTVTVSNTSVTASSRIFVCNNNDSGTAGAVRVSSKTAGTGFTIKSTSGTDASTVAWFIYEGQ